MTGQLSDFLATHAARVADELQRSGAEGGVPLVDAVLVALTTDDVRPMLTHFDLNGERPPGIDGRLDLALASLAAVRRATVAVATEDAEPDRRLEIATAAAEDLDSLGRRLIADVTGYLSKRASMPAKGSSMSITMHELRRPLTILNSYGQLLSTGMLGQLPETAMVAIEGITASTEMMVRMVNAIAEVSRLEDPDDLLAFELISVDEVVTAAVEHVTMEAKLRDTVIESEVSGDATFRGDRRRLVLALTNMLGNAVKHGPPGSMITVRAWADDAGAHFLVKDRGPGFPEADADHLFDKYFRSVSERQRKVPGSGLGLFIVKTVAERHHGTVAARSTPGEGSEFEMIIPTSQ